MGQYKDATGRLRRQPLAIDKAAAQAMLNEIVRNVEREKAGLIDPTDAQRNLKRRAWARSRRASGSRAAVCRDWGGSYGVKGGAPHDISADRVTSYAVD